MGSGSRTQSGEVKKEASGPKYNGKCPKCVSKRVVQDALVVLNLVDKRFSVTMRCAGCQYEFVVAGDLSSIEMVGEQETSK